MSDKQKLGQVIKELFRHQLEMKMYHFQTKYYGAHKASDCYLGKFTANLDQFMEVAQGEFGQIQLAKVKLDFPTLNDKNVKSSLDKFIKYAAKLKDEYDGYPELLAILDIVMADAQQLKYLLIFK